MARQTLFADAKRALAWSAIAKWLDVGGSTATFLAMVKLLGPETFGLYGMALVAVALPQAIVGGALSESIIQRRDLRPGHITATFWMEMALALVLFALMAALTPHLVKLFGHGELGVLIPAMAGTLFLLALGAAPAAQLQRELRFKAIAGVDAAGSITAAIVGLVLAALGFGVWALMWMEVARRVARAAGFAIFAGWRPALSFRMSDVRDLTRFNLVTLATRLASEADNAFPRFIIGALLGAQALGYFNLASRILQQAASIIIAPFWAVALPVASSAQRDRELLQATLNSATRLTSLLAFPMFLGAAAIAPLALPALLGREWAPAVPMVQILLLSGVRAGAAPLTFGVLRGIGAPGLSLAIVVGGAVLGLALTPLAAGWGLTAVALVLLGREGWLWVAGAAAMKRAIGYRLWDQFFLAWRSLLAAAMMAAAVLAIQALAPAPADALPRLAGLVLLGASIYAGMLFLLSPSLARRLGDILSAAARGDRATLFLLLRTVPNGAAGS